MKRKALTAILFVFALSQVACDKSSDEKFSDCMVDAACHAKMQAAVGPTLFPLASQAAAGAQVPAPTLAAANLQPFRVASVADAAIKAQSAKVAAAIKADDSNPLSTYYKSPTPEIPKATSSSDSAPARATASSSEAEAAVLPPGLESSGEASR